MKTDMTAQERFRKTINHQQVDRPPILGHWVPEVGQELEKHFEKHFGKCNVNDSLGIDFHGVWPKRTIPEEFAKSAVEKNSDGIYQDVESKPLSWIQTMDDVRKFKTRNEPDAYDYSVIYEQCLKASPYIRRFGHPGMFDIVNGLGARGIGLEEMLCGIMSEDPVVIALIDKHLENDYEFFRRVLEAGQGQIDVIHMGEDCGNQRCPIFPPDFFRKFFAPRMKRFIDLAHKHGAACMLHSCGSNRELLPIFIDIGLDILDVCQPEAEGMEPEGLKRDFGDKITFCGMLSLQQTFPNGTPEDCRREAEHRINIIGKDGGYIFSSGNSFTKDVPLENILAAYEAASGKRLI